MTQMTGLEKGTDFWKGHWHGGFSRQMRRAGNSADISGRNSWEQLEEGAGAPPGGACQPGLLPPRLGTPGGQGQGQGAYKALCCMEPGLGSCVASSGKGKKRDRGERCGGDSVRHGPRKAGLLESEEQEEKVRVAGDGPGTQAWPVSRGLREEGAAAPYQGLRKTLQRRCVSDLRQGKRRAHTRRPG